ncbi:MAG: signal recognition particle protein [Puniceicoccales bacterium]|jgi:signal recognition particle subunit SRP54|nr:signal recognition particle protein [Puniceicoccales bacterium]
MLEKISGKLQSAMRALRGLNTISEKNITGALAEVRDAFLDADVSFEVIRDFLEDIRQKSLGKKVMRSIAPGQQLVKIIHDALVDLLGKETKFSEEKPLRVLLVGLNGAGKTTSAVKLAKWLHWKEYKTLLVACDVQRPAAIDQLEQLAKEENIPCFVDRENHSPVAIAGRAVKFAKENGVDAIVFDTAGRLQGDGQSLAELVKMQRVVDAQEILLVVDAALGREAVNVARTFHEAVPLTGVLLTKLDGDARGGAALSMRHSTGVPIKFVGTGEHVEDLDVFRAEGMAQRILGMGDVVALVEKAHERVDKEEADRLSKRFKKAEFDFDDYLSQIEQIEKMGSMSALMKLLPGMGAARISPKELALVGQTKAIIRAMTKEERRRPQIVAGNRKLRIAKGSGVELRDVNHVLKQYEQMKKSMKMLKKPKGKKMLQQMTAKGSMEQISKMFGE